MDTHQTATETGPGAPDAELLIAPGCAHCAAVLAALTALVKRGDLGRLNVVQLGAHPEAVAAVGARSVPWIRIGPFELTGAHTQSELASWARRAGTPEGLRAYLLEQLQSGQLDSAITACRREPAFLPPLLSLSADLDTPFAARIGVGAVLEDLAPDGLLRGLVDAIDALLTHSPHAQVRADAAHFLGLTGSPGARVALQRLSSDENAEVREIAQESMTTLDESAR
ncbi:MAG: HEAT repeat domain-containing protein [Sedimenticolaceae bacterium]